MFTAKLINFMKGKSKSDPNRSWYKVSLLAEATERGSFEVLEQFVGEDVFNEYVNLSPMDEVRVVSGVSHGKLVVAHIKKKEER